MSLISVPIHASILILLHTRIRNTSCPLQSTVTTLACYSLLDEQCLAPFLEHQGLYANVTLYAHQPCHTISTAIDRF